MYLPSDSQVYAPRVGLAIAGSGLEVRWDLRGEGKFVPTGASKPTPEPAVERQEMAYVLLADREEFVRRALQA
eukprot:5332029-Lingulodinium_polyedra.AAC.1